MMTTVALSPSAAPRPTSPQPSGGGGGTGGGGASLMGSLVATGPSSQDKAVAVEASAVLDLEGGDAKAVADENASVNVPLGQETEAAAAAVAQPARHAKCAASPELQRLKKKRRRVAFEAADIVEFEPTVFTTTVTSGGIPLGMSLKERSRTRRRLDSFELERNEHRVDRQNYMEEGYLDPQERELILNQAGCEEPAMLTVEAEVNQIIIDRRESNEIDFEFLYGLADMEEEEEEDASNQVMLDDEQEADAGEEDEEDGDESNQEDDDVAALLSTSTTLEESSSDGDEALDNNSTDDDVASS